MLFIFFSRTLARLGSWAPLLLACNLSAQTVLLKDTFDDVPPGGLPKLVSEGGPWTTVHAGSGAAGLKVVADENEWFGGPTTNRFLRVENGVGFLLLAQNRFSAEIVTLSFDMVDRRTTVASSGSERLTVQFYAGDGSPDQTNRAHVLSLQNGAEIRSSAGIYGAGVRQRWDVIVNNSGSAISYASPRGQQSLPAGRAAVWLDGRLAVTNYVFSRQANYGPITSLAIQTFSTDRFNFEIDNIVLRQNASVLLTPAPRPAGARAFLGNDEALVNIPDCAGTTIPDFSNAGYMGGGVPIPDVPVRAELSPVAGDNTSHLQTAINQLSNLPLDQNGFRGALLLKAGTYHIYGQLTINASGVVLRGEGQHIGGTTLIAAGTGTRTLILVGGTSTASEVSNSRRTIVNDYVPVGARSFQVNSVSGLAVGDQIMVHRPSTAAWIDAIGMNAIPPRSDGLPVTQWAPGSYDLKFDRIITAISNNTVTIDAPLVNSLEKQFGGGSIYRYSWSSRINQVGIEDLRGVSEFASDSDEAHSWDCVKLRAVRNGWVRRVTGAHFAFSTVSIESGAKWVTVEDCSLLDPKAEVSGSRMYPFYVYGQLSLVQRCYARKARHDFATSSRVCGPNVFFDCASELSYADSGPHQRWAVGTLYDNVRVTNNNLNVQNRLNMGSGHGWSGANHVVWNSRAAQFAIQNPPTAQNWAIGLKGAKWAGSFPAYAKDGYWESHNTNVLPASLYTKQLQDRCGPSGAGGLISILNFSTTNLGIQSGSKVQFNLQRNGILDGSREIRLVASESDRALFASGTFNVPILFPANSNTLLVELSVHPLAWLPESRTVNISLVHGIGYSAGVNNQLQFTLSARPALYGQWQSHVFTSQEQENPEITRPSAAPAGDGVPNFVKYAFGIDPWIPTTLQDLPYASLHEGHLRMIFTRNKWISDIEYVPEVTGDLSSWNSGAEHIEISIQSQGDYEVVTVRDRHSTTNASSRFMRLLIRK
jgi:hypothetical protein